MPNKASTVRPTDEPIFILSQGRAALRTAEDVAEDALLLSLILALSGESIGSWTSMNGQQEVV